LTFPIREEKEEEKINVLLIDRIIAIASHLEPKILIETFVVSANFTFF